MSFEYLAGTFVSALVTGFIFYVLRCNIDQRKGILIEITAIGSMVIASALFSMLISSHASILRAKLLSINIVILGSLPLFVVARLLQRMRSGESATILDLFRLTTSVALMSWASSLIYQYVEPSSNALLYAAERFILLLTSSCLFIAGERSVQSPRPARVLSIAFASGFVVLAVLSIISGRTLPMLLDINEMFVYERIPWTFRPTEHCAVITCYVAPLVLAAPFLDSTFRHSQRVQTIGLGLSAWFFSRTNPEKALSRITPMRLWHFRKGVCYLNHGSFGAAPMFVRNAKEQYSRRLNDEPMDILVRDFESQWLDARLRVAAWVGTNPENIAFCENATAGMNEIASWFPLAKDDEVLINNHEYGAVRRIWQRQCKRRHAHLATATLPSKLDSQQQIIDAIIDACNEQTKLVILSHITSPTAMRLPVEQLCQQLKEKGIATCIDGPHALLQEKFRLHSLGCDFYTASCHKWLCASLGSGFVYVDPKWHDLVEPARLSWGRLNPNQPATWDEELLWTGSRDSSAMLTVPEAIKFFEYVDHEKLELRNHGLACYARSRLLEIEGSEPVTPEGREWFGWMVGVWLPAGNHVSLQRRLWENYRIEVPIVHFDNRYLIRVSCHLHTTTHDIDFLIRALQRELKNAEDA